MGAFEAQTKRRRDYSERLPDHYCAHCNGVVFDDDPTCLECGGGVPEQGWPSIQDGFDRWLGRVLDGRYLLTRRIGQGSTGSVYRAASLAIAREFAVKIINYKRPTAGLDGEQIRTRLNREIEAIGRLRNPHVVPFYEVLELFDSYVGVVMDFVDGITLEALVRQKGPLEPQRAVAMLRQIANGVHEAHEIGMIHRDLKPENIMIERMPIGDDFAHVLDFGIVRMEDGVTMTRGFLGTPLYASPEQAMGGTVDRRSDIYALGSILFFMLTGRPPFESESVYEILQSHVRTRPPTLSEVQPDPAFPAALEELVGNMLAKSPANRPQTLSAVISRIDGLMRSGVLQQIEDEEGIDSIELPIFSEDERIRTGAHASLLDEYKRSASSASTKPTKARRDMKDRAKADLFERKVSRDSVAAMLRSSRQKAHDFHADRVLRTDTGAFPLNMRVEGEIAYCAGSGEDLLLASDRNGRVLVADGAKPRVIYETDTKIRALCLAARGALIGEEDGRVVFADPEHDGDALLFQDVRRVPITSVAADLSAKNFLAGSESGRVYRGEAEAHSWNRIQDGPPVDALALSPDGGIFAVARRHKEIELFHQASIRSAFVRLNVPKRVRNMTFSADGHLLAILLEDNSVVIHLAMSGDRLLTIRDERRRIHNIAFNRKNELIGYLDVRGVLYGLDLQRELTAVQS